MKKKKFNLSGIAALLIAVLVLVVVVPINIIAGIYDKNIDMTPSSIYTLSSTTTQLLEENKDKDIEIYPTFVVRDLLTEPSYLPLYHTLQELEEYDNIKITEVIPDENPKLISEIDPNNALNIASGDIIVKHGEIIKQIKATAIFPYDENDVATYAGEELLAGAIKIVTNGSLPKIYFLTGHGEKSYDKEYSQYSEFLKTTNNYEADELDLSKVDQVPDDTAIIFLVGPKTDISDDELEKLRAFSQKGGAISVFMPPDDSDIIFDNIEDLLADFEIQMLYNAVEETNPNNIISELTPLEIMDGGDPNDASSKKNARVFAIDFTPTSDESFTVDLTSGMNEMVSDGDLAGISNTRSFIGIGSGSAYIEKSPVIQTKLNTDTTGASTGYSAVSVPCGGNDTTADYARSFDGQALYPSFYSINKLSGAKLMVFGTTDILESEVMPQTTWLTQMFSYSTLTWLFDSNYDMGIGNKGVTFDYMSFPGAEEATSVLRIFWIVPFCIAAMGILVWLKRRHS